MSVIKIEGMIPMRKKFKFFLDSCTLSGLIISCIGLYFMFFVAGIPYQDPTTEVQIKYTVALGTGETLIACGGVLFLVSVVCLFVIKVYTSFRNRTLGSEDIRKQEDSE